MVGWRNLHTDKKNAILIIVFLYAKYIISSSTVFTFHKYTNILSAILSALIIIVMLTINKFKINKKSFIILIGIITLYLLNMLMVNYKLYVAQWLLEFLMYNFIFLYIIGKSVDYEYLISFWNKIAVYTSVMTFIGVIIGTVDYVSYMFLGIYMSLNFIVMIFVLINQNKKKIYLLLTILGTFVVILLRCNKGSLVTIAIATVFIMHNNIKSKKVKIINILLLSIVTPLVYFNIKTIFRVTIGIANYLNMNTFTLNRWMYSLETGFKGGSAGRDILYEKAIDIIKSLNGLPGGVGAFKYMSDTIFEYPHNLILDVLIVLGPVLGCGVLILIIIKSINFFRQVKKYDYHKAMFFQMIFCYFIGRTLTSSTFLKERGFWIVIFMLLLTKNKQDRLLETVINKSNLTLG